MEKKNYTLYLISSQEDKPKTYNFNSIHIWIVFSLVAMVSLFFIVFFTVQYPRAIKYKKLNIEYQDLIQDRLKLTKIVNDYNRLLDMDKYIRSVLGTDLSLAEWDTTKREIDKDSLLAAKKSEGVNISYIENIPAFPPVDGYVTQGYYEDKVFTDDNHYGVDVAAAEGEPIKSAANGVVIFSNWINHLGNTVIIYHSDGYFSVYGHNLRNVVTARQHIERGEVIGFVGNTGISDGPHLHFEIWKNGIPLDPVKLIYSYKKTDISTNNYNR